MLTGAARRLSGDGGDPVIDLQTNFGGGKTHSMIALYHLASGKKAADLPGVGELFAEQSLSLPASIKRAVIVGQWVSPASPSVKPDGTKVHTLWGEIAHQLAGVEGYRLVEAEDLSGSNPGNKLIELFRLAGPSIVLIDEWVAYARQLPARENEPTLVGGHFDTQFTFAQTLTEAAKALHTSQPGVSKAIIELEEELGIEIFARHGKRLKRVTEPGQHVLKSIDLILREVGNLKRIGEQYSAEDLSLIHISEPTRPY